jgi:hypothetical protein
MPRQTNIVAVDLVTRETEVIYEGDVLSIVRDQHELLDNGNMVTAEFGVGRALEVTPQGEVVWAYVNACDENFVGEITNSDIFPTDFFETDFSECN